MKTTSDYSVETLSLVYSQNLTSKLDGKLVTIEGFYFDNKRKNYGTFYYDELRDKNKKNKITLQLTESIKSKLVSERYYQFQGYVNKGQSLTNDSRLQLYFRPIKVLKHEADVQLISKAEYDTVRERFNRDVPLIQDILLDKIENGEHPVIDIIIGIKSTSKEDYLSQLYNKEYYIIKHHNCNLSSQTEIRQFIDSYDFENTDLLIILRGGGNGLEVFNEIELCKKMIELPVPFITGIGHHEDVTLLQRVSDRSFSTPTSVGIFLQRVIDIYRERMRKLDEKEVELTHVKNETSKEKIVLQERINNQKKLLNKIYSIVFFMMLLITFLIYWNFK